MRIDRSGGRAGRPVGFDLIPATSYKHQRIPSELPHDRSARPPLGRSERMPSRTETTGEEDLSTEQAHPQAPPWFPRAHGDRGRATGAGAASRQGPQEAVGLTSLAGPPAAGADALPGTPHPKLVTIRRRSDFLSVRGGLRASSAAFAIEGKARGPALAAIVPPAIARFGFTVTKKLGGAVVRNRIRRRLKEAVRLSAHGLAVPGFDYVLIAREPALKRALAELQNDVRAALSRLHGAQGDSSPGAGRPARRRGPAGGRSGGPRDGTSGPAEK